MNKELPKAYEPKDYELDIYKKWEASGFFDPDNLPFIPPAPFEGGVSAPEVKSYTIVLPPPNVTGTLHLGHAAMLAIEDILIRYHRMKGERALWVPGTDHAAIATQTKVEKLIKQDGETRQSLGREAFLGRVREFARESHDTIVNQVKRMGASCDWGREAYTLDETRNKAVNAVFKLMYDDGLIYRGERIVNWCPRCHSTLADDEVEHKAQKAKLYYFKYDKDFPITIASTRPETKLGDTAVAVNPKDARYKDLVGKEFEAEYCGVKLRIKIIADRRIEQEFGSGALGVTPAHSQVDAEIAEANGLPSVKVIDEDGRIHQGFGEYSGLTAVEARALIVERLRSEGLMEKEEDIDNNISLCYRCDTPVEPLPSLQWFIDVNKPLSRRKQKTENRKQGIDFEGKSIKEVCLEVVRSGKIKIYPERFVKNYFNWMENLRPWCISRQIWFGHRVPVWYRTDDRRQTTDDREDEKTENRKQKTDIYVGMVEPEGEGWVQDEDTLDTWFSSGLWTFSTLANKPEQIRIEDGKLVIDSEDFRRFHPTQVLETGYDILFFWVARMIIMTTYAIGDIPFEDVYLHGLVLDEKGKKMSKSKGNVLDPLDMCDKFGTDATRMSLVIGSAPGSDMRLSQDKVASYRNFANKLWNVARFIMQKTENRKQKTELEQNLLSVADGWILEKLDKVIEGTTNDLDNYRFSQAGERLRDFTWNDVADWYLEASKFEKHEAKPAVLTYVLETLLKLWHPFIPYVTEVIWSEMPSSAEDTEGKGKLLMVEEWPVSNVMLERSDSIPPYQGPRDPIAPRRGSGLQDDNISDFELIKNIIIAIRNARAENRVEPGRKVKAVIAAGDKKELVASQVELIKGMRTGIGELEVLDNSDKIADAIYATANGVEIYLLGAVDADKEKARIAKETANLEKSIAALEAKLGNADFVARAPEPVVTKEREKLAGYQKELEGLKAR